MSIDEGIKFKQVLYDNEKERQMPIEEMIRMENNL